MNEEGHKSLVLSVYLLSWLSVLIYDNISSLQLKDIICGSVSLPIYPPVCSHIHIYRIVCSSHGSPFLMWYRLCHVIVSSVELYIWQEETAVLHNSRNSKPSCLEGDTICPLTLASFCRAVNAFSHSTFSKSLMDEKRTQKYIIWSLKPVLFPRCTRAKDNVSHLPVPCSSCRFTWSFSKTHKHLKTKGWKKKDWQEKLTKVFRDVFMLFPPLNFPKKSLSLC